jgi:hypothetical protein
MDTSPELVLQGSPLPPQTREKFRFWAIIRDFLIIQTLTGFGGFVIGVATGVGPQVGSKSWFAHIVSTFLFGTVGFTISGCLTPYNRWRHLGYVGIAVWLSNIYLIFFFGTSLTQWLNNSMFVGIMVGLGGALSYLFKKTAKSD